MGIREWFEGTQVARTIRVLKNGNDHVPKKNCSQLTETVNNLKGKK